jgi:membrane-associated phospholipid phosphatase
MYGIMINSKECAAEDKPGYFICLSQQKEKGIHMNTFLQSVQNLDGEILLQIQQHLRTDMLTPFMKIVTFLGNGGWFWILCAVVLLAVPKTRKTGYAAVLSLIFGVIVTNLLLKNIVARPRPFAEIEALIPLIAKPTDFSFPSGHTTASFAVALVMLRMLPKKIGIPAVVLAALVAFSRLYLGVHYPTDVLAGFVVALVGSSLAVWGVRTKLGNQ